MLSMRALTLALFVICVTLLNIILIVDVILYAESLDDPHGKFMTIDPNSAQDDELEEWTKKLLANHKEFEQEERENQIFYLQKEALFDPGILSLLPHLFSINKSSIEPLLITRRNLTRRRLVLCLSVVHRQISYIEGTLDSLIQNLDEEFRPHVVFIVMLAYGDTYPKSSYLTTKSLLSKFSREIAAGLLEIIAVPNEWYSLDFNSIRPTFNDSIKRMAWRLKQNLVLVVYDNKPRELGITLLHDECIELSCAAKVNDYIYMMNYGSKRADYYMQLEDDINATQSYMRIIFDYLYLKENRPWLSLQFTELGFIGKLFRSKDILHIVHAVALYYQYKPVDWIFYDVEKSRYCSPERNTSECKEALDACRIVIAPPLFQHVGSTSSLSGKVQKLKERYFERHNVKSKRGNPTALVESSMQTYHVNTAQAGYNNKGYMWFTKASANDYVRIKFSKPEKVVGILIISGVAPAVLDKLGPETALYAEYEDGTEQELGRFSTSGDLVVHLDGRMITLVEIRIQKPLERWVIIGYISIDVLKHSTPMAPRAGENEYRC